MRRLAKKLAAARRYGGAGYVLRRLLAPFYVEWLVVERRLSADDPPAPVEGRLRFAELGPGDARLDDRAAQARLAVGHLCFAMLLDDEPVATVWARTDAMWLPFLRRRVSLGAGEVYLYDSYTHPAHRARGMTTLRRAHTHAALAARGFHTARAYVLAENAPARAASLAAGYRVAERHRWVHLGRFGVELGASSTWRLVEA